MSEWPDGSRVSESSGVPVRREFWLTLAVGTVSATGVAMAAGTWRFLNPPIWDLKRSDADVIRLSVAQLSELVPGTVDERLRERHGVLLICLARRDVHRSKVFDVGVTNPSPDTVADGIANVNTNTVADTDRIVFALSIRCPHLGCAIFHDPGVSQLRCPCHGSRFSLDGTRLDGPATDDLAVVSLRVS